MKTFLVIILTIVLFSSIGLTQSVDEIIENNLNAKGGVEKIKALKTSKLTGKMIMNNFEMPFNMWHKKPNMLKYDFDFSGKKFTFGYDGKIVWQISPLTGTDEAQEITGEQAEQVKDNADLMDEPFVDYKKKGHKAELMGKEDLEGTEVFKLKLTRKNGKVAYYFIETESFIELKQTVTNKKKDGTEIVFETMLGDFKPVADVMVPHSLSIVVNGQSFGNIVIEAVEPNVELADDFFKMPPPPPKTESEKTAKEKDKE